MMRTLLLAACAAALPALGAPAAMLPPMGWNPWNAFRTEVTEAKIVKVAEILKNSGLQAAGYRYVNVDDGWWQQRGADGRIAVRTAMLPSALRPGGGTSLRPFVDRLHGMGFKVGLYTDIGRNACSQYWDPNSPNLPSGTQAEREIGSLDYQAQDMRLFFGDWNIDFLKVDACGLADFGPSSRAVQGGTYRALGPWISRKDPAQSDPARVEGLYAGLRAAIQAARPGGDYVLSICTWGTADAAEWAHRHGQLWRTSPDIHATWRSMLGNFDSAAARPLYAGPGRWNDPDMLQIGNGEFDARHLTEARSHFSLWAMLGSPLILGTDLTRADPALLALAGNRELIAINQDPAGHQATIVLREGDAQVLVKTLSDGGKAVALLNRGAAPLRIKVALADLHLDPHATATLRDLWSGQETRAQAGHISAALGARETALFVVRGRALQPGTVYLTEIPAQVRILADGRKAGTTDPHWIPVQADAAPSGAPLRIDGKRHRAGIGVLAGSRLLVDLDKGYRRFRATVGPIGDAGPRIAYRMIGDGRLLAEGQTGQAALLDVPLAGVRTLELVAEAQQPAGSPFEIAWGSARLQR